MFYLKDIGFVWFERPVAFVTLALLSPSFEKWLGKSWQNHERQRAYNKNERHLTVKPKTCCLKGMS
jgi:hypothetical protein